MKIYQYVWSAVDSNSWLMIEGDCGLLIDAVDNNNLYDAIRGIRELTIILTHSHFDHISGLNRIRKLKPESDVIATEQCSHYLGNIYKNMSSTATAFLSFYKDGANLDYAVEPFTCMPADKTFINRHKLDWHGHRVELFSVYGHSDDGLMAVINKKALFSGDTLLSMPTVTRFPTGNTKRFWAEDMRLIKQMRSDLVVYPGHGEQGLLRDMLMING